MHDVSIELVAWYGHHASSLAKRYPELAPVFEALDRARDDLAARNAEALAELEDELDGYKSLCHEYEDEIRVARAEIEGIVGALSVLMSMSAASQVRDELTILHHRATDVLYVLK